MRRGADSLSMPATSHRHNALLSTSKKTIHVDFCIHGGNSSFRMSRVYDTSGFIGGRQRSGHDENLKQHFDNSVQTAIQKKLAQYYGQDAQRVTAR